MKTLSTSLHDVWPEIQVPQRVETEVATFSRETMAELARNKARQKWDQDNRNAAIHEENYTEGRMRRPFPSNPHD